MLRIQSILNIQGTQSTPSIQNILDIQGILRVQGTLGVRNLAHSVLSHRGPSVEWAYDVVGNEPGALGLGS